jgi:hypothetical protein
MKLVLTALAALLLVGACASGPEPTEAVNQAACRNVDPPTGSRLVRRQDCSATAEADRARAQQDAKQLQDLQQQIAPAVMR